MSKPTFIKITVLVAVIMVAASAAFLLFRGSHDVRLVFPGNAGELTALAVYIPGGRYTIGSREPGCRPVQVVNINGYYLLPFEVPLSWWRVFEPETGLTEAPQQPLHSVSYEDAERFCAWFSRQFGVVARLPTVAEWEVAARAGKAGMPYPWGWGRSEGRAVFNARSPRPVASMKPNAWGLYNMSGNMAEWALDQDGLGQAPVLGGSWAERDPRLLRISHNLLLPNIYRDKDVGFRLLFEAPLHTHIEPNK